MAPAHKLNPRANLAKLDDPDFLFIGLYEEAYRTQGSYQNAVKTCRSTLSNMLARCERTDRT